MPRLNPTSITAINNEFDSLLVSMVETDKDGNPVLYDADDKPTTDGSGTYKMKALPEDPKKARIHIFAIGGKQERIIQLCTDLADTLQAGKDVLDFIDLTTEKLELAKAPAKK